MGHFSPNVHPRVLRSFLQLTVSSKAINHYALIHNGWHHLVANNQYSFTVCTAVHKHYLAVRQNIVINVHILVNSRK